MRKNFSGTDLKKPLHFIENRENRSINKKNT